MTGLVPVYRRRPSALHSARAGASTAFCAAFVLVATLYDNPLVLAGALGAIVVAGITARVGPELGRTARLGAPLALLVALVNPLVAVEGQTLLVRGGSIDLLAHHRLDVTLEELAYGGVIGLRALVIVLAFGLFSATVDPDEVMKLVRRFSYRSALTASLATRLVPVLARDAARMGDAARCRPVAPGRAAAVRAVLASSLDRAVDVAAALEVRGYARARRPRPERRPWSRHDLRVAAAAGALASVALTARLAGLGSFRPYPELGPPGGAGEWALALAVVLLAAAPAAGRGGRLGVAHA